MTPRFAAPFSASCSRRAVFALALLLVAVTAARLVLVLALPLFPDEAIYALVAARAPFHFYTQPPAIALLIRAGEGVLGHSEAGARLASLLLTTLALWPTYLLARDLGGWRVALWTVAAVALTPIYLLFGALATPDAAQLFCWALALFCTWRALHSAQTRWWLAAGGAVCLGLFVKYTFALYFPSLLLCLLLVREWRPQLRRPGIYLGLAVPLLGFAPLALWQLGADHDAALSYHLARRHVWQPPQWNEFFYYQAAHTFYISSLLYFLALAATFWALWRGRRRQNEKLLFLGSFAAVTYLFFLLITSFTARTLHREHWDAIAYLPAIIAAGLMLQQSALFQRWRKTAALCVLAPAALGLVLLSLEGASGAASRVLGTAPWFAPMLGWREMAVAIDAHTPDAVLCESGQSAVEYAFYRRSTPRVYTANSQWNRQMGVQELFADLKLDAARLPMGTQNVIAVGGPYATPEELRRWDETLRRHFISVTPLPDLQIRHDGRVLKLFVLRRCEGVRQPFFASP